MAAEKARTLEITVRRLNAGEADVIVEGATPDDVNGPFVQEKVMSAVRSEGFSDPAIRPIPSNRVKRLENGRIRRTFRVADAS